MTTPPISLSRRLSRHLSRLAAEVYRQLAVRVRSKTPSITYGELAERVSRKIPTHPRSRRLHAALAEVTVACRARHLPCLPAIVWRHDTQRPSDGYYKLAHPRVHTAGGKIAAWERELAAVVGDPGQFPASLRLDKLPR